MNTKNADAYLPLVMLSAASGARSMTGIAAVAQARARSEERQVRSDSSESVLPRIVKRVNSAVDQKIAMGAAVLAVAELIGDVSPGIPDRTDPGPLIGRCVAGAIVGASVAQFTGMDRKSSAIAGAITAFASAHVSYQARRALGSVLPNVLAGVVEDVSVLALAAAGMQLLIQRDPTN